MFGAFCIDVNIVKVCLDIINSVQHTIDVSLASAGCIIQAHRHPIPSVHVTRSRKYEKSALSETLICQKNERRSSLAKYFIPSNVSNNKLMFFIGKMSDIVESFSFPMIYYKSILRCLWNNKGRACKGYILNWDIKPFFQEVFDSFRNNSLYIGRISSKFI